MKASPFRVGTLLLVTLLAIAARPARATTYLGNGNTGFGGVIGDATLAITNNSSLINFVLNAGASFGNDDDLVMYIDSVPGGFSDTSTFADNTDGGHIAISGEDSNNSGDGGASTQTVATFPTGFLADYALVVDPTDSFAGLYQLASGGNGSLVYQSSAATNYSNPSTNTYDFQLHAADLGLTGATFSFVGTLISQTAYRSNETFGNSSTTASGGSAPNAGFNGTQTFTSSDTFTLVPEGSTWGMMACGVGVLVVWRRGRKK
jgi:hypothetical protein